MDSSNWEKKSAAGRIASLFIFSTALSIMFFITINAGSASSFFMLITKCSSIELPEV